MPEGSERVCFTLEDEVGDCAGGPPVEVQLLPAGEVSPKGKTPFVVDEESRELIMAAYEAGSTDLVIDYEHQSLSGTEAPAAGWVTGLVDRGGDGIWASVRWTERASGYLAGREYRYISPVVLIRKSDGRAVELLGAALTNLPAIDGMSPVVNKAAGADGNQPVTGPDYRTMYGNVMGMLGLSPDDGPEVAGMAVAAFMDREGYVPSSEHEALKEALRTHEADGLIREALMDGRLTPPMASWAREYAASDMEGFREFLKSACPVVPLFRGAGGGHNPIDAAQREMNALLGITGEQFLRQSMKG